MRVTRLQGLVQWARLDSKQAGHHSARHGESRNSGVEQGLLTVPHAPRLGVESAGFRSPGGRGVDNPDPAKSPLHGKQVRGVFRQSPFRVVSGGLAGAFTGLACPFVVVPVGIGGRGRSTRSAH